MGLLAAIEESKAEIADAGQGTPRQPKDGSTEWFVLRARASGLAYLQCLQQRAVENDPGACERVYRAGAKHFKQAEVPEAPVIVREVLSEPL